MAVRVKKKGTPGQGVVKLVAEYKQIKQMQKMWGDKEAEVKARLVSILDEEGVTDDKGHLWYELPEAVGNVTRLHKQKRTSQVIDQGVAEELLKRLELWDDCTTEVTVLDEDAMLALGFQGKIPEAVMAEIIQEHTNYAFYLR